MKRVFLLFGLISFLMDTYCQEKIIVTTEEVDTIIISKMKQKETQLDEINMYFEKRNNNYVPEFSEWKKCNKLLQTFETSQEINLFKGKYVREVIFKPLIDEHKHRLIIDIRYTWMDCNFDLDSGKTYFLIVSGLASTSNRKLSLWIGPEGKSELFNNFPKYSVIGRLGDNLVFSIGKKTEITPKKTSHLYLGYNDDLYVDNIGFYVVDIFELSEKETIVKLNDKGISIGSFYTE
jgi:hypothetical protein